MTNDTIRVHTEGPNAYENAKKQLQAQNADPEQIGEVEVEITVEASEQKALPASEEDETARNNLNIIGQFMKLRNEPVKAEDGRNIGGLRVYPGLRFIADNASEEHPVRTADVRDATGLGNGTSSLLSDLSDAGLVTRHQPDEGNKKPYIYTGLTARGKAELERYEQILAE